VGANAFDNASSGGQQLGIGFAAGAGRHGQDYKQMGVHKQGLTINEQPFIYRVAARERRRAT
jgi:hypothetical protein